MGEGLRWSAVQGGGVPGYEVLRRLAVGGMGEVFLARRVGVEGFSKLVVIKRLLPELALDERFAEMFVREAKLGALLVHPNIAQVLELGRDRGDLFMVMEYVPGANLAAWVRGRTRMGRPFTPERAAFIGHEVAAALEYAHQARAPDGTPLCKVHRDVSPHNVLLSVDGAVKLSDFGIARAPIGAHRTRTGEVRGKVPYMSPEQARGQSDLDARSDLFSFGTMLFELVTLARPFGSDGEGARERIIVGDRPKIHDLRPDLPPEFVAVVDRAMAHSPADRFASAAELRAALYACGPFDTSVMREGLAGDLARDLPEEIAAARAHLADAVGSPQAAGPASPDAPTVSLQPRDGERSSAGRLPGAPPAKRRRAVLVLATVALGVATAALGWRLTHADGERTEPPHPPREKAVAGSSRPPPAPPAPETAAAPVAPPSGGFLTLRVPAGWGSVYVDGDLLRRTAPFRRHPLPAGTHAVRVHLSNGAEHTFEVEIVPGGHVERVVGGPEDPAGP